MCKKQVEIQDVVEMVKTVENSDPPKMKILKSLCNLSFRCRNNREMRLQAKAFKRFEEVLDIREIFKVHVNLSLLISLLLNKEQAFLLQHQAQAALIDKPKDMKPNKFA